MSSSSFPLSQRYRSGNASSRTNANCTTTTSGDTATTASFDNLRRFAPAEDDDDDAAAAWSNVWVTKFLAQRGNDLYLRIPDDYLRDRFNLTDLHEQVPHFADAWRLMVGDRPAAASAAARSGPQRSAALPLTRDQLQAAAQQLYGLLHARYCLSPDGCLALLHRMRRKEYGCCARVLCGGADAPLLPVAMSDEPNRGTVKLYCARCDEVYEPRLARHAQLDGAHFGTGLPHMLFMSHPQMRPTRSERRYVGTLFGFRLADGRRPEEEEGAQTRAAARTTTAVATATTAVATAQKGSRK